MKKIVLLAAIATMGGASALLAADKACSPADAQKAQKAVDMVVSWQQLNKAWKDWRHCDTGEVGDTFTDALLRLLVEWKNVDVLGNELKDDEFKGFVQAHLRSPMAKDDLGSVRSRATLSCPKTQQDTCATIAQAAGQPDVSDNLLAPMAPLTTAPATK
jgi:hypothetical protein